MFRCKDKKSKLYVNFDELPTPFKWLVFFCLPPSPQNLIIGIEKRSPVMDAALLRLLGWLRTLAWEQGKEKQSLQHDIFAWRTQVSGNDLQEIEAKCNCQASEPGIQKY
jgi:hypothetical protein